VLFLVIVASAPALIGGATVVLGRKFSASRFWDDVANYNVNVFVVSIFLLYNNILVFNKHIVHW
jgi:hypothetical protein